MYPVLGLSQLLSSGIGAGFFTGMKKLTILIFAIVVTGATCARAASVQEETQIYSNPPHDDDKELATLPEGTELKILEIPRSNSPNRGWISVKTSTQEGWVSKHALHLDEDEQYEYNKLNTSQIRISLEGGAFKNVTQNSSLEPRFAANLDFSLPTHWVVGGFIDNYEFNYGSTHVERSNLMFSGGYEFGDPGLTVRGFVGFQTTSTSGYDNASTTAGGLSLSYRLPLSRKWDIGLNLIWQHFPETTLSHDTGTPVTNDAAINSLCTIFTLGLSNGCGNQTTSVTIPKSDAISLNLSIGFLFF